MFQFYHIHLITMKLSGFYLAILVFSPFILPSCAQNKVVAPRTDLTSKARGSYSVGDSVRNFSLKNYDGKKVSLTDFKAAKGIVIVFMRNTCEYCQAYESRIIALDKKYKPLGYPLIAISPFGDDPKNYPKDDLPHMKLMAEKRGYTFPYLSDDKLRITNLFDDQYTPVSYILQHKNGKMILIYAGDIDDDWENIHPVKKNFTASKLDSLLRLR